MSTSLPDRALSVRQPWAELILAGRKRYELRSWRTSYRGPILIHSGLRVEAKAVALAGLHNQALATGALVGVVEIADCQPFTEAIANEMRGALAYFGDWMPNLFAWELANPSRLNPPISHSGRLGLFRARVVMDAT